LFLFGLTKRKTNPIAKFSRKFVSQVKKHLFNIFFKNYYSYNAAYYKQNRSFPMMEKNQKIKACLKLVVITAMPLKEKNSARLHRASNRFSFLTRHVIYSLTPLSKGPPFEYSIIPFKRILYFRLMKNWIIIR